MKDKQTSVAVKRVSTWFERIGIVSLAAMALATLVDVIGSKAFQRPLPGSTEITGLLQVIAIAGGIAFSKLDGRHIRVEFLVDWLPESGRAILDGFGALLGLLFFIIAAWMSYNFGLSLYQANTSTFLLRIPLFPFVFWITLAFMPMCVVLLLELLTAIKRIFK